jgi:septal ring factor EnvC (AmiA/AmiB activator)
MMAVKKILLILFLFLGICPSDSFAQSRKQLEAKRKKMQREISEQRKALSNTQQEKTVTLDKLNSLNQIIQQRQVVINNLGLEIRSVNYELTQKQKYLEPYSGKQPAETKAQKNSSQSLQNAKKRTGNCLCIFVEVHFSGDATLEISEENICVSSPSNFSHHRPKSVLRKGDWTIRRGKTREIGADVRERK